MASDGVLYFYKLLYDQWVIKKGGAAQMKSYLNKFYTVYNLIIIFSIYNKSRYFLNLGAIQSQTRIVSSEEQLLIHLIHFKSIMALLISNTEL